MESVYSETRNGLQIEVCQDAYAESPYSEHDCLSQIVHWHRRGFEGDDVRGLMESSRDRADFERRLKAQYGAVLLLPLYLYEHSGQTVRLGAPFGDPWDSGQVGYVLVSRARLKELCGYDRLTKKRRESVVSSVEAEVREFDAYLQGGVYHWTVSDGEGTIDGCGGYYGGSLTNPCPDVPDYEGREAGYALLDARECADAHARRTQTPALPGLFDAIDAQAACL